MEGQSGKIQETTAAKIITPKGEYITIFKDSSDGLYYGKKRDGTVELLVGGSAGGPFLPLAGGNMDEGAKAKSATDGNAAITFSDLSLDLNVINGVDDVDDDFIGGGINYKTSTIATVRVGIGIVKDSLIGLIPTPVRGIIVTELRIRTFGVPAYDDNAAAVAAGLAQGDMYQTTGLGALAFAGVLVLVQ